MIAGWSEPPAMVNALEPWTVHGHWLKRDPNYHDHKVAGNSFVNGLETAFQFTNMKLTQGIEWIHRNPMGPWFWFFGVVAVFSVAGRRRSTSGVFVQIAESSERWSSHGFLRRCHWCCHTFVSSVLSFGPFPRKPKSIFLPEGGTGRDTMGEGRCLLRQTTELTSPISDKAWTCHNHSYTKEVNWKHFIQSRFHILHKSYMMMFRGGQKASIAAAIQYAFQAVIWK